MTHRLIAAASLALFAVAGCASVGQPAGAAPRATNAANAPVARSSYRLDYVIAGTEGGKAPANSTYTVHVEERSAAEVRLGANVPLSGTARQDVGVLIRSHVDEAGDRLRLRSTVEVSALEEPPAVRKMVASTDLVVGLGKPALVARMDDPATHRRYEVTVTATKVE